MLDAASSRLLAPSCPPSNFGWGEAAGGVSGMLSAYARIGTPVTRLNKYGLQHLTLLRLR